MRPVTISSPLAKPLPSLPPVFPLPNVSIDVSIASIGGISMVFVAAVVPTPFSGKEQFDTSTAQCAICKRRPSTVYDHFNHIIYDLYTLHL